MLHTPRASPPDPTFVPRFPIENADPRAQFGHNVATLDASRLDYYPGPHEYPETYARTQHTIGECQEIVPCACTLSPQPATVGKSVNYSIRNILTTSPPQNLNIAPHQSITSHAMTQNPNRRRPKPTALRSSLGPTIQGHDSVVLPQELAIQSVEIKVDFPCSGTSDLRPIIQFRPLLNRLN